MKRPNRSGLKGHPYFTPMWQRKVGVSPLLWMVQAGLVLMVHGAQALQYPPTDAKSLQHLPQQVPPVPSFLDISINFNITS